MKNVKKTAITGLAALLATSAVVPAAVASADNSAVTALKEVVLELTDGSKVQVDYEAYKAAKTAEIEWAEKAKVIGTVGSDEATYAIKDFIEAKTAAEGDLAATLTLLAENKKPVEIKDVKKAEVKDGELVVKDETPEEKVNETFFYNLAA